MRLNHYAAMLAAGIAVISYQGKSWAQNEPALAGAVRSPEGAPLEGVPVTATKANSTIAVTAITNHQGRYSFPADRLSPGAYALTIPPTGSDLHGTPTATLPAQQPA